jgi:hypothetical protein
MSDIDIKAVSVFMRELSYVSGLSMTGKPRRHGSKLSFSSPSKIGGYNMADVTLINGDCLEEMKDIPDGSVDLTVTSPPYDNLRMI